MKTEALLHEWNHRKLNVTNGLWNLITCKSYVFENVNEQEAHGPIGHLNNCSVTVAMYIQVNYNYKANEIIINISGLFNPINLLNSKKKYFKELKHN